MLRIHTIIKYLIGLVLLASAGKSIAQSQTDFDLHYTRRDIDIEHKLTLNTASLSAALIKHKNSDKEKFDVIFAWVASNIRYDFDVYYAPKGNAATDLKRVLRRRKGICLDYATLMDSLCFYAGLSNAIVYGYAKDQIFDVNDSLYLDNHAWNAVKLDGLWYLYDVTASSGDVEYQFTRFTRFIFWLSAKFPDEYKRKPVKHQKHLQKCNQPDDTLYYYKSRWFNAFVQKLLAKFSVRVKQVFTQRLNTDFYLTDPDILGITHLPDNRVWSLVPGITMRSFEQDSLFYHLSDSVYRWQNRRGQLCPGCDRERSLDTPGRLRYLRDESAKLNPRNHFIVSLCDYDLGELHHQKAVDAGDSLIKVHEFDTTMTYLEQSRANLKLSEKNIGIDYKLQEKKNRHKQNLLLTDNKTHVRFIRSKIQVTLARKRTMSSLFSKSLSYLGKYNKRAHRLSHLPVQTTVNTSGRQNQKKQEKLKVQLTEKEQQVDSLNTLIKDYKRSFEILNRNLSYHVWQKVRYHDSLIVPVRQSIGYRNLWKDNYKKLIVELRKKMPAAEEKYAHDIDSLLYVPAKTMEELFLKITRLIDRRNNYENDIRRLKLLLVKFNQLPLSGLAEDKAGLVAENQEDYCWLYTRLPAMGVSIKGFAELRKVQGRTLHVILEENAVERYRAYLVNKELKRRKSKYESIMINNTHIAIVKLKKAEREKHAYLKELDRIRKRKM